MAYTWHFAAARPLLPDTEDPFTAGLGGTEQSLLHLTTALAARGHEVTVSASKRVRTLGGVTWLAPDTRVRADITVAINDAGLLPSAPGLPIVWFHNEVEVMREVRKRRLPALFRHRPAAVFIGSEQARLASRLLPFRARATITYGLPPQILTAEPGAGIPPPQVIFTSQAYRGLKEIIGMWRGQIAPANPRARLTAYINAGDVAAYAAFAAGCPSISIRPRIGNDAVLETLRGTRLLLAPGHRSETFCLAAAEAIAMGVPVVTLGIGSLKERVVHGQTGFIAGGYKALGEHTIALLGDDKLWSAMHAHALATRQDAAWAQKAAAWEDLIRDLQPRA